MSDIRLPVMVVLGFLAVDKTTLVDRDVDPVFDPENVT
jgi:hypothetical protein